MQKAPTIWAPFILVIRFGGKLAWRPSEMTASQKVEV